MVVLKGDSRAARCGSVWIHCESCETAAKASIVAWSTVIASPLTAGCPTNALMAAMESRILGMKSVPFASGRPDMAWRLFL
ncbi:hypothetical protein D3C78_1468630 [compost metagenome]